MWKKDKFLDLVFKYEIVEEERWYALGYVLRNLYKGKPPVKTHIEKISPVNLKVPSGRGRHSAVTVNAKGIHELICKSSRVPILYRRQMIEYLNSQNCSDFQLSYSSVEAVFVDELTIFLRELNPSILIDYQANISGYLVDVLINNKYVIECDEVSHLYKNQPLERQRFDIISNKGYSVLRLNSLDNIGLNLAKAIKFLPTNIWSQK